MNVQPVLGICYGRVKSKYLRGYHKVVGQNFWYLISEDEELYKEIIAPLGYKAKEYNDEFARKRTRIENEFTLDLTTVRLK